jgi:hypothetical protein
MVACKGSVKLRRGLCVALASLLVASIPAAPARAELVSSEAVLGGSATLAHAQIAELLARPEVRAELERMGVPPAEAQARVAALSDAEARAVQQRLQELPAGQGFIGFVVGVLVVTVTVFVITDLLGLTDVFTFIQPLPRGTAKSR